MSGPGRGAVLAIDHGSKRTGFAVTDALRTFVQPLAAYRGAGDGEGLLDHVAALCADRAVEVLLVGDPRSAAGGPGPRAKEIDAFCDRLRARFPHARIERIDETLTTKEAESRLVDAGHTGKARRERRDSWSAMVMLEEWLARGG